LNKGEKIFFPTRDPDFGCMTGVLTGDNNGSLTVLISGGRVIPEGGVIPEAWRFPEGRLS